MRIPTDLEIRALHERVAPTPEAFELVWTHCLIVCRIAERATGSRIAYLHFLNEDQNTIELGAWSQATLRECTAVSDRHYPVADAGIWADSARFGRPVVHNDYEHLAGAKGLPPGHSP